MVSKERAIQVKMGKLLSFSSKFLLDRFLTDEADEEYALIKAKDFSQRLQLAAERHVLVVLQIQIKQAKQPETVSGWVLTKRRSCEQVIIKLLDKPAQLRLVEVNSIVKMSQLPLAPEPGELSNQA